MSNYPLDPAFAVIEAQLADYVGGIAAGESIDLHGLNDDVERLCRAALMAPDLDRTVTLARFERLSRGVDWLRRSLVSSNAA